MKPPLLSWCRLKESYETSFVVMVPTKGKYTAGIKPVIMRGIASVIQSNAVVRITQAALASLAWHISVRVMRLKHR